MTGSRACCAVASESLTDCERCSLTERVLSRRPNLLGLAKRHSVSVADAEDAVQEAITRALERLDYLDPDRVEGWLATVTLNLCRDMARDRGRRRQRLHYQYRQMIPEQHVDEEVAERAYAACVATLVRTLPDTQRTVLELRAEAMPIDKIAAELGITTKSAESLLSRGRRAMRAIAVSMQGTVACLLLRRRAGVKAAHAAAPYASVVTAAAVALATVATPAPEHSHVFVASPMARAIVVRPIHGSSRLLGKAAPRREPAGWIHPSDPKPTATTSAIHAVPLDVRTGGVSRRKPSQSFVESVEACVEDGVTVSPSYIGCNAAE